MFRSEGEIWHTIHKKPVNQRIDELRSSASISANRRRIEPRIFFAGSPCTFTSDFGRCKWPTNRGHSYPRLESGHDIDCFKIVLYNRQPAGAKGEFLKFILQELTLHTHTAESYMFVLDCPDRGEVFEYRQLSPGK